MTKNVKMWMLAAVLFFGFIYNVHAEKEVLLGNTKVVKSIKLEKPMRLNSFVSVEGNYAAYSRKEHQLVLISPEGKLLWSYSKKGKGPGEFSEAALVSSYYNKTLYVCDNMNQKILLFTYDDAKKTLTYSDEYLFNEGRIVRIFVSESGKIFTSPLMGGHEFLEVNSDFSIAKKYFPLDKSQSNDPFSGDVMGNWLSLFAGNETYLLRAGEISSTMQFLKYDGSTFVELKKREAVRKSKNAKVDTKKSKGTVMKNVEAAGISGSAFFNNQYFIICQLPESEKESIIEVYSEKGDYKGYYIIENSENEIVSHVVFNKDQTFAYQKDIKGNDNKKTLDESTLYIGTIN